VRATLPRRYCSDADMSPDSDGGVTMAEDARRGGELATTFDMCCCRRERASPRSSRSSNASLSAEVTIGRVMVNFEPVPTSDSTFTEQRTSRSKHFSQQ